MTADLPAPVRLALESAGLPFEVLPCDPALADTALYCEHYGIPLDRSVNCILVKAKTGGERYVACVLLATARLDVNRTVRKRIGARRVSFASPDETRAMTGMEPGGVTPLGLPESLTLMVDAAVMACEWIVLGGGNRSTKIKVAPALFERTPATEIVEGLAFPPAADPS